MGKLYQYNLYPKDPLDQRRYCWNKVPSYVPDDVLTYGNWGARATYYYGEDLYVFNGYVDGINPVFFYKIDKKKFTVEKVDMTLETTYLETSDLFINEKNVNGVDIEDYKLRVIGELIPYGSDWYGIAKCEDPALFDGYVLYRIRMGDYIDNNLAKVPVNLIAITSGNLLTSDEEVIEVLGIYNSKLYFWGKASSHETYNDLWNINLWTHSVAKNIIQGGDFAGGQTYAMISNKLFIVGGKYYDPYSQSLGMKDAIWMINLQTYQMTYRDYTTSTLKIPSPLYQPILITKDNQLMMLSQGQHKDFTAFIARISTDTLEVRGIEVIDTGFRDKTVAEPIYDRAIDPMGVIPVSDGFLDIRSEYIGKTDTMYRFTFIGNNQFEVLKDTIDLGTYQYIDGQTIELEDVKVAVVGTFNVGDKIRLPCGLTANAITPNCGIRYIDMYYYFDTRSCRMWICNLIDAMPLDTGIQMYDYVCRFNGMVLMNEKVHSKIDDNKYMVVYK